MVTFDPDVWLAEGKAIHTVADTFYRSCHDLITAYTWAANTTSPIETTMHDQDLDKHDHWHRLIAGVYEGLTGVSSRMIGTGQDYADTEEANANERFWQ